MKTLLLCGASPHQRALAHRLHAIHPLSAIIAVRLPPPAKRNWPQALASASIGMPLGRAWRRLMRLYDATYPDFPLEPTIHRSANAPEVRTFIQMQAPDLVLVSGTDLLKAPLIAAVSGKIMNLHTGISPYIKGAPNCTNWALATSEFGLIGNTVLWLDAGIDSGNIISTERTPLTGRETLFELHRKVMDHAHDLYARAYRLFVLGGALPSVPQAGIGKGRLFLSRHWTLSRMAGALINFFTRFGPNSLERGPRPILIALPPELGE